MWQHRSVGRARSFDEAEVLARAAAAFRTTGYEGTGVDELLAAVRLHRGSMYQAFGSKRGIFLAALRSTLAAGHLDDDTVDLVLVALVELAPRDAEVRGLLAAHLCRLSRPEAVCGERLLARAGITASTATRRGEP